MVYREPLPADCPPDNAEEAQVEMTVFRLIRAQEPHDDDFHSYRLQNPSRSYPVGECIASGLSVYTERTDVEKALLLPKFKNRSVCAITLTPEAGKILQTGRPSHHTWWLYKDFNILENSKPLI